jgi:hypothetical protein
LGVFLCHCNESVDKVKSLFNIRNLFLEFFFVSLLLPSNNPYFFVQVTYEFSRLGLPIQLLVDRNHLVPIGVHDQLLALLLLLELSKFVAEGAQDF